MRCATNVSLIPVDGIQAFFVNDMNLLRKYLTDYCVEKISEPGSIKKYFMSVVDIRSFIICEFILETCRNLHKQKENKQTFEKESTSEYHCQRWWNQLLTKQWKLKASRRSLQCTDWKPINAYKSKTLYLSMISSFIKYIFLLHIHQVLQAI